MVLFIIAEFVFELILDLRNDKSWDKPIPPELDGIYDAEKYKKAQQYHKERGRFGLISGTFGTLVSLLFLLLKGFAWLHLEVIQQVEHPILQTLVFFGILGIASGIIGFPFEVYSTFVIEEKYGFNKTTWKTFITDKIKGILLGGLIGGLLLSAFVAFFIYAGPLFWLYAWMLFSVFSIFMVMFYTTWIVPIFNKLAPLENGSLREKIEQFAQSVAFPLTNVFVIDGSKRSTKANAYFSGLGSKKTIVLYDTLIKDHSDEELVSVLAHEVGHYKKKHIRLGIILSILQMGLLLFILSVFLTRPELNYALGLQSDVPVFHLGLIAFTLLYSPFSFITGIFMNLLSRKNEFEADNYAKETTGTPEFLVSALKKLSGNNLSNLQPDKWYVFFHYSHPPLLERVRNLMKS